MDEVVLTDLSRVDLAVNTEKSSPTFSRQRDYLLSGCLLSALDMAPKCVPQLHAVLWHGLPLLPALILLLFAVRFGNLVVLAHGKYLGWLVTGNII